VRFIETPVFTATLRRQLDDETYRALQLALLLRPEQGLIIRGSGGLRKLRWGVPHRGRGKRGGLRLIYYWEPDLDVIYMLYLYAKNEQGDMTPAQLRVLRRLVQEEFQ
jgi:mRNA-degrading endonuclease RelE of RelBE toxin-antitoxin system